MTILSLHPAKILTTGEGGAVLTDDDDLADAPAALPQPRDRHRARGPDRLDVRDGRARLQLPADRHRGGSRQLAARAARARSSSVVAQLAARYLTRLEGHPHLDVPVVDARHRSGLALLLRAAPARHACASTGAASTSALRAEGIGVNVHYIPVHQHPYYRERYPGLAFPVAEAAYERLLTLPLHAGMTTADVDDVVGRARQGHRRLPGRMSPMMRSSRSSRRGWARPGCPARSWRRSAASRSSCGALAAMRAVAVVETSSSPIDRRGRRRPAGGRPPSSRVPGPSGPDPRRPDPLLGGRRAGYGPDVRDPRDGRQPVRGPRRRGASARAR